MVTGPSKPFFIVGEGFAKERVSGVGKHGVREVVEGL